MAQASRLSELVRGTLTPDRPARLGVAVSGGSDSVALLHLLDDWRREGGPDLAVVTVDHGLRPEAAAEAAGVAAICAGLGLPHDTLHWQWDGQGNLPDAARRGRYEGIAGWARAAGIGAVALGHTADDQAETVLMRLARGSGVDGLSGMAAARQAHGIRWLRPLLAARRADLRACLAARGVAWVDDPSNDDTGYERVKMRQALAMLEPLGIDAPGLLATAARLAMARDALARHAADFAAAHCRTEAGDVLIARAPLANLPRETALRVFSQALCHVSSAAYRPRLATSEQALDRAIAGETGTVSGCLVTVGVVTSGADAVRVSREYNAVRGLVTQAPGLWDSRWLISGPGTEGPETEGAKTEGAETRALGEQGLALCPDWRATGLPRTTLLASPSVWIRGDLQSAPLAGRPGAWAATRRCGDDDFVTSLLSH